MSNTKTKTGVKGGNGSRSTRTAADIAMRAREDSEAFISANLKRKPKKQGK